MPFIRIDRSVCVACSEVEVELQGCGIQPCICHYLHLPSVHAGLFNVMACDVLSVHTGVNPRWGEDGIFFFFPIRFYLWSHVGVSVQCLVLFPFCGLVLRLQTSLWTEYLDHFSQGLSCIWGGISSIFKAQVANESCCCIPSGLVTPRGAVPRIILALFYVWIISIHIIPFMTIVFLFFPGWKCCFSAFREKSWPSWASRSWVSSM